MRKTADMASGFASGGLGKVFTNARKMANNLGLGEQVMKLKNVMQSLAMKSPKMASVLSTSGHVATQYGKSLVMEQAMQEGMRYELVGDLVEKLGGDKMRAALTWVSIMNGSKRSGGKNNSSGITDGGGSSSGSGSGKKDKTKKDTEKTKKEDTDKTKKEDTSKKDKDKPKSKKEETNKPDKTKGPEPSKKDKDSTTSKKEGDKKDSSGKSKNKDDGTITVKKYGEWKNDKSGKQKHHLNQDAAFKKDGNGKEVIPSEEGYTIELEGNAFKDIGSPHFMAHKTMEEFFHRYRIGDKKGSIPTNAEYNVALYKSLRKAGLTEKQALDVVEKGREQRLKYGLKDDDPIPKIPGQINSIYKYLFQPIKLK
ncbi:hypothetical protein [Paenibacillus glacialis]|uniref:Uncharacterized protein n=1 Tax=Paenibacillus glacialis TaxID=494026 RepID=A0A168I4A6_9BACL|nr:hypothetical protein [Paenibacillus glacialis]OAB38852.1 hypothetical protein PGLA_19545 [Paenibacillus glacialis]